MKHLLPSHKSIPLEKLQCSVMRAIQWGWVKGLGCGCKKRMPDMLVRHYGECIKERRYFNTVETGGKVCAKPGTSASTKHREGRGLTLIYTNNSLGPSRPFVQLNSGPGSWGVVAGAICRPQAAGVWQRERPLHLWVPSLAGSSHPPLGNEEPGMGGRGRGPCQAKASAPPVPQHTEGDPRLGWASAWVGKADLSDLSVPPLVFRLQSLANGELGELGVDGRACNSQAKAPPPITPHTEVDQHQGQGQ